MRRATIGGAMVEGELYTRIYAAIIPESTNSCVMILAMVEYSLDLDVPDYVFDHPTIRAMSDATTDIMTWPNVRPVHLHSIHYFS